MDEHSMLWWVPHLWDYPPYSNSKEGFTNCPPKEFIFESLNNAYDNRDFILGGALHNKPADYIAADLKAYDVHCEHDDVTEEYLIPIIKEWMTIKGIKHETQD